MENEFFEHFGIKFCNSKIKKHLNRENFAIINKSCGNDKYIKYRTEHWDYFEKIKETIDINRYSINAWPPSYKYSMENGILKLSDEFCKKYQEACFSVYDANMIFFEKLNKKEFEKLINTVIHKNKNYYEVTDLNKLNQISGIYIMILDEYKQIYIGQSKNIKQRILNHWKKEPPFDTLIFPNINTSNIPIDSFGVLDTTRIFVKNITMKNPHSLDNEEEKIVKQIPQEYLINRICGGLRLKTDYDFLKGLESLNKRNFNI